MPRRDGISAYRVAGHKPAEPARRARQPCGYLLNDELDRRAFLENSLPGRRGRQAETLSV